MTRFVVDDKAHANSKIRSVLADDPAALALWTVAGSWCGDQTNDGFVPDHQVPWLIPVGGEELARKLVRHGLWRRVRGGYQFHEWSADGDGTRRNLTREEVLANRQKKAEAGRKGGLARAKNAEREGNEKKVHEVEEKVSDIEEGTSVLPFPTRTGDETTGEHATTSDYASSTSQAHASADASAPAKALVSPNTNTNTYKEHASPPDGFDEAWSAYPRHVGKTAARKAYAKAIQGGATASAILDGVKRYAADCTRKRTEQTYIAHMATWLNAGRWEDDLAATTVAERPTAWWLQ